MAKQLHHFIKFHQIPINQKAVHNALYNNAFR
jgi:hypothetical protein